MSSILLSVMLILCGVAENLNAEEEVIDEHFKEMRKLAVDLAGMQKKEARMDAADIIYALETNGNSTTLTVLKQLLADAEIDVRIHAFQALGRAARAASYISDEEARAFSGPLLEEISKENIDLLFEKKPPVKEMALFLEKAGALNSMLLWFPIKSPLGFQNWQIETYGYLVSRLASRRLDYDEKMEGILATLTDGLVDPLACHNTLPSLMDDWDSLSARRIRSTILSLWDNPYYGANGLLGQNLKDTLKSRLGLIKDKLKDLPEDRLSAYTSKILKELSE